MTVSFIVSKREREKCGKKRKEKLGFLNSQTKKGRNIFTYIRHWWLRCGTRREGRLCNKR